VCGACGLGSQQLGRQCASAGWLQPPGPVLIAPCVSPPCCFICITSLKPQVYSSNPTVELIADMAAGANEGTF
jgi:hypothetical protein